VAHHDELLRDVIEAHGGHVVKTTGDGFHAAFCERDRSSHSCDEDLFA
jgi:class 3 adenylate cyclase